MDRQMTTERSNVISLANSQESTALQQFEEDLHDAIMKAADAGVSQIAIVGLLQCHLFMETQIVINPDMIE